MYLTAFLTVVDSGHRGEEARVGLIVRRSPRRGIEAHRRLRQQAVPAYFSEKSGVSPNETPNSPRSEANKRRQGQTWKTKEQEIAMARGGVLCGRMVFHRKGVKLTEDSPRSMLPRDVSRCMKNEIDSPFLFFSTNFNSS